MVLKGHSVALISTVSTVPVNFVVLAQHCAMAFLLVRPSLTHRMNCGVCSQFWCTYGARFVPRSSVYLLFFHQPMHRKPQMQYVPLIGSWHVVLHVLGPCRAQANASVILSLPGMPRVRSPVCIFGRGLPLFVEPHYILRCHVCSNFIALSGQVFLISPAVDIAYAGHCFATAHCATIHFSVPFVTCFRWCQPFIDNSSFARDLDILLE